tara:strand:+ start:119 stop:262 length:144 start_codon:yes stop_codon:yes gene_type:complete
MQNACPHRYSTVTECFSSGVVTPPKSYITHEIDFLEIILELKDKYNK